MPPEQVVDRAVIGCANLKIVVVDRDGDELSAVFRSELRLDPGANKLIAEPGKLVGFTSVSRRLVEVVAINISESLS